MRFGVGLWVSGLACALLCAGGAPIPLAAQQRWTMQELWRIGGADAGPEAFVYVKGLAVDTRGRVFVYDRSTQDIRLFGADGRLVRIIGRKGSGPGELRDAEGIAFAPTGQLWVRDAANARFTIFSGEGEYERTWTTSFCSSQEMWAPRMDERDRFVDVDCVVRGGPAVVPVLLAYHPVRAQVDTLGDRPECGTRAQEEAARWVTRTERRTMSRDIPHAPRALWALGKDAVVWCAPTSARFEIVGVSVVSRDTIRISRPVPAVPIPRAEREATIARLTAAGARGLDFDRMPKVRPAIEQLVVDDRGRLWVRSTNRDGAVEFNVFSASGIHLASATLGRYRSPAWLPFVVRGMGLYAVVYDEDDVPYVAHFRITA